MASKGSVYQVGSDLLYLTWYGVLTVGVNKGAMERDVG